MNKFTQSLAEVLKTNPWETISKENKSKRMWHDEIANKFGEAVSRKFPHKEVTCWTIYGGEDEYAWQYAIKMENWFTQVKRNRKDEDPQ